MNYRRAGVVIGGLAALLVANFFAISFMMGYAAALGSYDVGGVLAVVAGTIFVAPFNLVLFERLVDYAAREVADDA